jgi:hypothetical protein
LVRRLPFSKAFLKRIRIKQEKEAKMTYDKLKKAVVTLALGVTFMVGLGLSDSAQAQAQSWRGRHNRIERVRERASLERLRRLDFQRRLRYQHFGGNRIVGYHDRFGRFHRYGWYDRFGRLHLY